MISILCSFVGLTEKDIVFAYLLFNNTSNIRTVHVFYKLPGGRIEIDEKKRSAAAAAMWQ